ncbi:GNAT family N-acetyltransferase [Nocardia sp. CA-129566]|uniref:GNAT family N-acetyltransferase n=1 Tax=Nocardia sp. CA-129566 TaxID=3239976 RepID=UPI003D96E8E7
MPEPPRRTDAVLLRVPRASDEQVVRAAHAELAECGFDFALGLEPGMTWSRYLSTLEERRIGAGLPPGIVPETFLVATVDDEIIGRASVRHTLNPALARRGGHIGYAVLRRFRGRGYGTAILRASVAVAHGLGVDRILVTCDDTNAASAHIIESCGGRSTRSSRGPTAHWYAGTGSAEAPTTRTPRIQAAAVAVCATGSVHCRKGSAHGRYRRFHGRADRWERGADN